MSQEDRKLEIIEAMHAGDRRVGDSSDRISNLDQYQRYALEQTFGKEVARRRTFRDLVEFYETLNLTFDLGLFDEVIDLGLACASVEKDMEVAFCNEDDRSTLHTKLDEYFKRDAEAQMRYNALNCTPVLYDVDLIAEETSKLYDAIIITSGGILFLEVIHPDRNISINENGVCMAFYYKEARLAKFDLLQELNMKKVFLADIVETLGFERVPIIPIVVFSGKLAYANLCKKIKTVRDYRIGECLDEICKDKLIGLHDQCKIAKIFYKYQMNMDYICYEMVTSFVEVYADLRSKVEAKLSIEANRPSSIH